MSEETRNLQENRADTEPVRLNKYLSDAGICSRREADRLIEQGQVTVDGEPAALGQKILPGQKVLVNGRSVQPKQEMVLLAFHKPLSVECTTAKDNPDNIVDYIHYPTRIFPIGRLDKNSTGLILLTNEGSLSDRILRGSNYHEKEYVVSVNKPITSSFLKQMERGVEIELEDGARRVMTRPCRVRAESETCFRIILTQGLNRQIRRMCETLGYKVMSLKRIRVLNIELKDLPEGTYRPVSGKELEELLRRLH